MRNRIVLGGLALLLAWLAVFGVDYLGRGRLAIWATPTSEAAKPADLRPITVPARGRVCADSIPFGPEVRYVAVRVLPATGTATTGPLLFEIRAADRYYATATVPAGLPGGARAIAKVKPYKDEIYGVLCVYNKSSRPLDLAGVPRNGSYASSSKFYINDKPFEDRELSITLLSGTHQSLAARFGSILAHVAAFRPIGAWLVWVVLALLVAGVPVATLRALSWAAERDGSSPPSPPPSDPR
jgi:hypothetical protein